MTIYSIFKEHREYKDSRIEHIGIHITKEAALSRYGRLGGIVSILPICLDMAGLAGVALTVIENRSDVGLGPEDE